MPFPRRRRNPWDLQSRPYGTPVALMSPRVGTHHCKEETTINNGDPAWLLVSAALVLFMTPGLALFYGGMVRRKNILGTIVQSLILVGLISVEWALVGYSMAFGPDHGGIIGDLSWLGVSGVGDRRVDPEHGGPRLRRGHGRPHHLRGLGAGGGPGRGETEGVRLGQHGAA